MTMTLRFGAVLLALCALVRGEKTVVSVDGWEESPLFSHAIVSNGMVYLAGVVGVDMETMELCPGGIKNETLCAFDSIGRVLGAAGTTLDNVVDCTVFLGTMDDYDGMNEAYTSVFTKDPPARAAFAAAGIAMGAAAEFKCIATT